MAWLPLRPRPRAPTWPAQPVWQELFNSLLVPSSHGIGLFPALTDAEATEVVEVPAWQRSSTRSPVPCGAPRAPEGRHPRVDIQVLQGAGEVLDWIAAVQVEVPLSPSTRECRRMTNDGPEMAGRLGLEPTR